METTSTTQTRHPVLACAAEITHALKDVSDVDPMFMTAADKAAALLELTRLENQLASLRLRVIAASGDVAEQDGSRNVGTWLGPRTLTDTAATPPPSTSPTTSPTIGRWSERASVRVR